MCASLLSIFSHFSSLIFSFLFSSILFSFLFSSGHSLRFSSILFSSLPFSSFLFSSILFSFLFSPFSSLYFLSHLISPFLFFLSSSSHLLYSLISVFLSHLLSSFPSLHFKEKSIAITFSLTLSDSTNHSIIQHPVLDVSFPFTDACTQNHSSVWYVIEISQMGSIIDPHLITSTINLLRPTAKNIYLLIPRC